MAHGTSIKSIGGPSVHPEDPTTVHSDGSHPTGGSSDPDIVLPKRMDGRRAPDSRSGTWKITWRGGSDPNDVYVKTFSDLFERQLNAFSSPRVFLLGDGQTSDLAKIRARAAAVAVGEANTSRSAEFDVVWDAGLLSRAQLPERLRLVQALDDRLKVGGSCIVVTHGKRGADDTFASLLPEEIAAYFFPAYIVAGHEEHEFALPPGKPVSFHTLILLKQSPLTCEMLDLELHRSLHAVASKRRFQSR